MNELRKLSNQLTLLRIVLIPVLWALAALKMNTAFAIFLLTAGLTDALDGFLARRFKQASDFGVWFDSFADNLLIASAAFWMWLLLPQLVYQHITTIGILLGLFALSIVIGFIRYKKMINFHLYSGKLAAVIVYVFLIHALLFMPNLTFFYIASLFAAWSFIEETLVIITHKTFPKNKKSIFF